MLDEYSRRRLKEIQLGVNLANDPISQSGRGHAPAAFLCPIVSKPLLHQSSFHASSECTSDALTRVPRLRSRLHPAIV